MFGRDKRLKKAFRAVRDELDEHLEAINRDTQEILENRAMILEMQERLCKLADQIADIKLRLEHEPEEQFPDDIELSLRQQEVFLTLYTASEPISYSEASRKLSLPVSLVQEIVYSLIQEGIPVIKQRSDTGQVLLSLDLEFCEEQSKRNVVGIDEAVSKQVSRDLQLSLFE